MSKNILIIGGTGRSGTSILNRIFSHHPEVTNVPEWRFLIDPDGIIDFYHNALKWSPYNYDIKLKRLEKLFSAVGHQSILDYCNKIIKKLKIDFLLPFKIMPRYTGIQTQKFCPDFGGHVQELINNLKQFSFSGYWVGMSFGQPNKMRYHCFNDKKELTNILSGFLYSVIQSVLTQQDCNYYLEKNTWNILWYDSIRELVPNAKLVHIYRDPRDVVSSFAKQAWMPSDPVQGAIIYRDLMNRWWHVRQSLPTDCYYEISLEHLVREPQHVLMRICQFWGVPWSDRLLDIHLNRSHTGRWKRDLTQKQQDDVQMILKDQILKLGYWEG